MLSYLRSYISHGGAMLRDRRRNRRWARALTARLEQGSLLAPPPPIVQLMVTERCNLRCRMCNSWGDRGVYREDHVPQQMDPGLLDAVLKQVAPFRPLLSIHGGEPLFHDDLPGVIDQLAGLPLDLIITTNGTLLGPHADRLARLDRGAYLVSIDGAEAAHDRIRGAGSFSAMRDGVRALVRAYRRRVGRLPLLMMNFTISEFTTHDDIVQAFDVARALELLVINYTLRWFVSEAVGWRYELELERHFNVASSGTWRGFLGDVSDIDPRVIASALTAVQRRCTPLRPPFIKVFPRLPRLDASHLARYFGDHGDTFGRQRCLFPFYAPRIYANGDMVFCQGYRDLVGGNLTRMPFEAAYQSETARRLREFCLRRRFSICSRCCGLYLSYCADTFQDHWRRPS